MAKRIARPRPKVTVTTTSPLVTDDASKGYQYFSGWYNSITGELFTCVDPTVGAASVAGFAVEHGAPVARFVAIAFQATADTRRAGEAASGAKAQNQNIQFPSSSRRKFILCR